MDGYDIHLQIQGLKKEIMELSEEIMALDPEHPDVYHLLILKDKSENELEQLLDLDVVEHQFFGSLPIGCLSL